MKKTLLLSVCFCVALFLITGCTYDEDIATTNAENNLSTNANTSDLTRTPTTSAPTYTLFIYLCGTDLESEDQMATMNLEELMAVPSSKNVNIIIQTGGTKEWHTPDINPNYIQRFKVSEGTLEHLENVDLVSMGEAETLGRFLTWGAEAYPADQFGLIMWNHGAGSVDGVAFDELFESDGLTLSEMDIALEQFDNLTQKPMSFIGFDACLMSTIETAITLAPYADYMIASEEVEPGAGWDYYAFANEIVMNPSIQGDALGQIICDSYLEKCAAYEQDDMVTLSVTDLTKAASLLTSFEAVASELDQGITNIDVLSNVAKGAKRSESYGGENEGEGYSNLIDLGDLIDNINTSLPETAQPCLQAINDCIVYKVNGSKRSESTGLSIFFPSNLVLDDPSLLARYNEIGFSQNYKDLLANLTQGSAITNEVEDLYNEFSTSEIGEEFINDDGYYQMNLTPEFVDIISSVRYVLSQNFDGVELLYGSDNDVVVDWETGIVEDNFRGVWPTLNQHFVSFNLIEEQEDYNLYSIPILLNGSATNIRAAWIYDSEDINDSTGHFEILGLWDGLDSETGIPSRDYYTFQDGDEIIPLFDAYDESSEEYFTIESEPFYVEGEVTLTEEALPSDNYNFAFEIEDIFGELHYSYFITFNVDEDGEISIQD